MVCSLFPLFDHSLIESGITGQDGSYLTELLLEKGYTVHGIIRRSSSFNTGRLHHLYEDQHERPNKYVFRRLSNVSSVLISCRFHLHYGDLTDSTALVFLMARILPTEVYNLGAQSHVKVLYHSSSSLLCPTRNFPGVLFACRIHRRCRCDWYLEAFGRYQNLRPD